MFSTNTLFKANIRLVFIFLGFILLKTEPKRTSLLGLLSRCLTPSQNTKENSWKLKIEGMNDAET